MDAFVGSTLKPAGTAATVPIELEDDFARAEEAAEFVGELKLALRVREIAVALCSRNDEFGQESEATLDGFTVYVYLLLHMPS
jgi:hypothetical protein